jgi:hypothetical protein
MAPMQAALVPCARNKVNNFIHIEQATAQNHYLTTMVQVLEFAVAPHSSHTTVHMSEVVCKVARMIIEPTG